MKTKITLLLFVISINHLVAQDWIQKDKITALDAKVSTLFGHSVAISDQYAVVGVPNETADENSDGNVNKAGAVYIYKRENSSWLFEQKIVASDRGSFSEFGSAVAIDENTIVVGSVSQDIHQGSLRDNAGAAYVFEKVGESWLQTKKLVASDRFTGARFGSSIAISGDYLVVGAENENPSSGFLINGQGAAYLFKREMGTWIEIKKIIASDGVREDFFGTSVGISGDFIVVSSPGEEVNDTDGIIGAQGAVYVYQNNNDQWDQTKKLVANERQINDEFGNSVAISGNYIVVGAKLEDEDENDENSISFAGSAYIFQYENEEWVQTQKIVASDREELSFFGTSVAIDNDMILIGADIEDKDEGGMNVLDAAGAAYLYQLNDSTWEEVQKIVPNDREKAQVFGRSVTLSNGYALVGSPLDDPNSLINAGSAYVFSSANITSTLEKIASNIEVSIYPNPVSDYLMIELENSDQVYVKIISMNGIIQKEFMLETNRVDLKDLNKGVYTIELFTDTQEKVMTFVK